METGGTFGFTVCSPAKLVSRSTSSDGYGRGLATRLRVPGVTSGSALARTAA
jgi:hypothetical protein